MSIEDRFWTRVDRQCQGPCWEWKGSRYGAGYGQFYWGGKNIVAHRFSYELHKGPIPNGLVVHHECENPWCVNPEHLEAITQRENVMRGKVGRKEVVKSKGQREIVLPRRRVERIIWLLGGAPDLADILGVHSTTVWNWQRNDRIPAKWQPRLMELAQANGIELKAEDLIG